MRATYGSVGLIWRYRSIMNQEPLHQSVHCEVLFRLHCLRTCMCIKESVKLSRALYLSPGVCLHHYLIGQCFTWLPQTWRYLYTLNLYTKNGETASHFYDFIVYSFDIFILLAFEFIVKNISLTKASFMVGGNRQCEPSVSLGLKFWTPRPIIICEIVHHYFHY